MPLVRGLAKVRESKQESDNRKGDARRFMINTGESRILRFFGNFENNEDPIMAAVHYVKRLPKGQQYQQCGKNDDSHPGCVLCHLQPSDKGIGWPNLRAYFWIRDYSKYHKMDAAVNVIKASYVQQVGKAPKPSDYYETKYPACTATRTRQCEWCKMGNTAIDNGFKYWELATKYADGLVSQQAALREYCLCGARDEEGGHTLYVTQYLCSNPKCNAEVEFDPLSGNVVVACGHCRKTLTPTEVLACTAECGNPRRADLQDFLFKVTKTGDEQSTNYNFEPIHPVRPPTEEELAESNEKKPVWEDLVRPDPAEVQAKNLGLPESPIKTPGHGATAYGGAKPAPGPSAAPQTRVAPAAPKGPPAAPAKKKFSFKKPAVEFDNSEPEDSGDIVYS